MSFVTSREFPFNKIFKICYNKFRIFVSVRHIGKTERGISNIEIADTLIDMTYKNIVMDKQEKPSKSIWPPGTYIIGKHTFHCPKITTQIVQKQIQVVLNHNDSILSLYV